MKRSTYSPDFVEPSPKKPRLVDSYQAQVFPFDMLYKICALGDFEELTAMMTTCKSFLIAFCTQTYLVPTLEYLLNKDTPHVCMVDLPQLLTTSLPRDWIRDKLPPIAWNLSTAKYWSPYLRSKLGKDKDFFITGGTICQAMYSSDWQCDLDVWKGAEKSRAVEKPLHDVEDWIESDRKKLKQKLLDYWESQKDFEDEIYQVVSYRRRINEPDKVQEKTYSSPPLTLERWDVRKTPSPSSSSSNESEEEEGLTVLLPTNCEKNSTIEMVGLTIQTAIDKLFRRRNNGFISASSLRTRQRDVQDEHKQEEYLKSLEEAQQDDQIVDLRKSGFLPRPSIPETPRHKIDVVHLKPTQDCFKIIEEFDLSLVMQGILYPEETQYCTPLSLYTAYTKEVVVNRFFNKIAEVYAGFPGDDDEDPDNKKINPTIRWFLIYTLCQHLYATDPEDRHTQSTQLSIRNCSECREQINNRRRRQEAGITQEAWREFVQKVSDESPFVGYNSPELRVGFRSLAKFGEICGLSEDSLKEVKLIGLEWSVVASVLNIYAQDLSRWSGRLYKYKCRFPDYNFTLAVPKAYFPHNVYPFMPEYLSKAVTYAMKFGEDKGLV